ncbi:MAG TPA: penicillin acylase family protein [bacterium]|nr:penicillin acylase family protein [bacterium]
MHPALSPDSLRNCVPDVTRAFTLRGLEGPVTIHRDAFGIAHVRAGSESDAHFAQGFVHAQDRLWHMECDRRRAYGRWAEAMGPAGLAEDRMMRRFRIGPALPRLYDGLQPETRAMLEAYAHGVNAFLENARGLPVEFELTDVKPQPWLPLDSLAVFCVRHILMGVWESKIWRARMLHAMGPEKVAAFHPGYAPGQLVIVPPDGRFGGAPLHAYETLKDALGHLTWLRHGNADGSNNWVVGGARTASGKPIVAGDPHRALDVPNVYYQNHVACDAFDVIGFSFPGVPGFPHFAHSARVAWAITHGSADYQDLYIERFDPKDATRYEHRGEWLTARRDRETIQVRGAAPETLETWETLHGPIVGGEPAEGTALAFRYTALETPNGTLDAVRAMLLARNADELEAAVRTWVDPVNNMVYADVDGNFGYRTRGRLPVRSEANAWVPVPGWTGEHEWSGNVAFEAMPAVRNPACGYAYTANNRIVDEHYPHYIGLDFAPGFRAERIHTHLRGLTGATVDHMAAIHADVGSVPAEAFRPLYGRVKPADAAGEQALALLRDWDGQVTRESPAPTIFATWRKHILLRLFTPQFDAALLRDILTAVDRGANGLLTRTQARLHQLIADNDTSVLPPGESWDALISAALGDAVAELSARLGADPAQWHWEREHHTAAAHLLAAQHPDALHLLNPPPIRMGGDGDTVQAGGYYVAQDLRARFISVARYVFDTGDWDNSRWIVPGGVSGHPGSPHYQDQAGLYEMHRTLPMTYSWDAIEREAKATQTLSPQ